MFQELVNILRFASCLSIPGSGPEPGQENQRKQLHPHCGTLYLLIQNSELYAVQLEYRKYNITPLWDPVSANTEL